MNGNEARRLANSINSHRPDWLVSSLTTFITRNMAGWTYRDASVALTWVATDAKPDGTPASDKPGRVLENGPWRIAATVGGSATPGRPHPLKPGEDCPHHIGQPAGNCGGCRADQLAEDRPQPPPAAWQPGDTAAGAKAAREAIHAAKAAPTRAVESAEPQEASE